MVARHGSFKDFFQWWWSSRVFSERFFKVRPNVVKFSCYPSKLKNNFFLLIISKSRREKAFPSDAHVAG